MVHFSEGVLMNRTLKTVLLFAAAIASTSASAALFDTIDSVKPLQEIAAQKMKSNDRMPAGIATEAKDEKSSDSEKESAPPKTE